MKHYPSCQNTNCYAYAYGYCMTDNIMYVMAMRANCCTRK